MHAKDIIHWWFKEVGPDKWFVRDIALDRQIRKKFLSIYEEVVRGEKETWRKSPRGRLAEIIVLDQFARNMFRGKAASFMYDPLALALAQEAVRLGADKKLAKDERRFLYMPFMHSESSVIHKKALRLFTELGDAGSLWYEKEHKKIIDRFGRYPHRNKVLGRKSTREEKNFLKTHQGF